MDDSIVTLRNTPITLDSDVGRQFVVDCVRAGEGLITDRELAEKYELDPPAWIAITKDVELGHAIRAERERRVLNGVAAREAAAKHFVKAPGILDQIMTDANASEIATLPQARAESYHDHPCSQVRVAPARARAGKAKTPAVPTMSR